MKKIYISPETRVYEVEPSGVVCGSGDAKVSMGTGDETTRPLMNGDDDIVVESSSYRCNLWGN